MYYTEICLSQTLMFCAYIREWRHLVVSVVFPHKISASSQKRLAMWNRRSWIWTAVNGEMSKDEGYLMCFYMYALASTTATTQPPGTSYI